MNYAYENFLTFNIKMLKLHLNLKSLNVSCTDID